MYPAGHFGMKNSTVMQNEIYSTSIQMKWSWEKQLFGNFQTMTLHMASLRFRAYYSNGLEIQHNDENQEHLEFQN